MEDDGGTRDVYRGQLDDFRIFRRCLSDKEVAELYKGNGDETYLQGEGRVKLGPLCEVGGEKNPNAQRAAPQSSISTQEALDRVGKAIAPVLDRLNPKPPVERRAGHPSSLYVTYRTRAKKPYVRPPEQPGFHKDVRDNIGLENDGFELFVEVQRRGVNNQLITPQTVHEPNLTSDLDVTPIGNTDKQIYWVLSYRGAPEETLRNIRTALTGLQSEEGKPPYEARLPSGITVELYGVSENPSKDRQWWRPDGSPLDKRPYESMGSVLNYKGSTTRELAILLKHLPKEPVDLRVQFDPPCQVRAEPNPQSLLPAEAEPGRFRGPLLHKKPTCSPTRSVGPRKRKRRTSASA